jgi:hypothetical protein
VKIGSRVAKLFGLAALLAGGFLTNAAPSAAAAGLPESVVFTNADLGGPYGGLTPYFAESGGWQLSWSFTCPDQTPDGFQVYYITQSDPLWGFDNGPAVYDVASGSGTSYYFDTGTLRLTIDTSCQFRIVITPNRNPPTGPDVTFSSSALGAQMVDTPYFVESGPWTMSYSYDCHGLEGTFEPVAFQSIGSNKRDGATVMGTGGSGSQTFTDTGLFHIFTWTACDWTITITGPPTRAGCKGTLPADSTIGMATAADGKGYWIASRSGAVTACGDAPPYGSGKPGTVAIAGSPDGDGYWLVSATGQVQAFGSASNQGSIPTGTHLAKPIVAMAADPATGGYWLLGGDGGVFAFNAPFYGSTGNIHLDKPAVGMAATTNGNGYYFVASDGGIFAFGDARFYGSTGNTTLTQPVVGMAIDPATGGYWMDAADGGIFAFHAPFEGSTGDAKLAQSCVGMTAMPDGTGYRFAAADGGIFAFHAPFEGSAA